MLGGLDYVMPRPPPCKWEGEGGGQEMTGNRKGEGEGWASSLSICRRVNCQAWPLRSHFVFDKGALNIPTASVFVCAIQIKPPPQTYSPPPRPPLTSPPRQTSLLTSDRFPKASFTQQATSPNAWKSISLFINVVPPFRTFSVFPQSQTHHRGLLSHFLFISIIFIFSTHNNVEQVKHKMLHLNVSKGDRLVTTLVGFCFDQKNIKIAKKNLSSKTPLSDTSI